MSKSKTILVYIPTPLLRDAAHALGFRRSAAYEQMAAELLDLIREDTGRAGRIYEDKTGIRLERIERLCEVLDERECWRWLVAALHKAVKCAQDLEEEE